MKLNRKSSFIVHFSLIALAVLSSCKKEKDNDDKTEPDKQELPVPNVLELLTGDNQQAFLGDTLPKKIEVVIKDQNNNPMAGVKVEFSVQEGSVSSTMDSSSSTGKVSVIWVLGSTTKDSQKLIIKAFNSDGTLELMGSPLKVIALIKVPVLKIGDFHEGGIIFQLDSTDQHGLVVTTEDQRLYSNWNDAKGPFSFNSYSDWYLPNKEEWTLMYNQTTAIGSGSQAQGGLGIRQSYYWTSEAIGFSNAWKILASNGYFEQESKSTNCVVRAIRKF